MPTPGSLHHGLAIPNPSGSGLGQSDLEAWFHELEQVTSPSWSSNPSTQYTSESGGSLSSHYSEGLAPASVGSMSVLAPESEELALTSDGSPSSFLNENMVKKLKIVAGLTVVGSIVASIAGLQIKHKHRDYQES